MRILVLRTLLATALLSLALMPFTVSAQAIEAFKMGVVDPQAVLEKSKAGKKSLGWAQRVCHHQTKVVVRG